MTENAEFDDAANKGEQAQDQQPESAIDRHDHAGHENRGDNQPKNNDQKHVHAARSVTNPAPHASPNPPANTGQPYLPGFAPGRSKSVCCKPHVCRSIPK